MCNRIIEISRLKEFAVKIEFFNDFFGIIFGQVANMKISFAKMGKYRFSITFNNIWIIYWTQIIEIRFWFKSNGLDNLLCILKWNSRSLVPFKHFENEQKHWKFELVYFHCIFIYEYKFWLLIKDIILLNVTKIVVLTCFWGIVYCWNQKNSFFRSVSFWVHDILRTYVYIFMKLGTYNKLMCIFKMSYSYIKIISLSVENKYFC